jgi:hypothetical protein
MAELASSMTAVADTDTLCVGLSPSMAMGFCYVAMADSMAHAMANAVDYQQRGQTTAGAALVQVLRLIIAAGSK